MLTDNREVIADILDGLADAWPYSTGPVVYWRHGAATLRWTAAFEAAAAEPCPDELAELERLRDQFDAISEALIGRDANGKLMTPFAFRKLVAQVLA